MLSVLRLVWAFLHIGLLNSSSSPDEQTCSSAQCLSSQSSSVEVQEFAAEKMGLLQVGIDTHQPSFPWNSWFPRETRPADSSKQLPKPCVVVVSTASSAVGLHRANAGRVGAVCDYIIGHYDSDTTSYEAEQWYHELVVLAKLQRYNNKVDLTRDLVQHNMDTLGQYDFVLLVDDDVGLENMDVPGLLGWFATSPYNIVSPTIVGRTDGMNPDRCSVRVTDGLEQQALLFKGKRIADWAAVVLPETIGSDGLIACDRGLGKVICRALDGNTGTGCAIVSLFGSTTDRNTKTMDSHSEEKVALCNRMDDLYHFGARKDYYRRIPTVWRPENYTFFQSQPDAWRRYCINGDALPIAA